MSPSLKGFSIINGKIQNPEHEKLLREITPMPMKADGWKSKRNADLVKPLTEEERKDVATIVADEPAAAEPKKKRGGRR